MAHSENLDTDVAAMTTIFTNIGGPGCVAAIEQNLVMLAENIKLSADEAAQKDGLSPDHFRLITNTMAGLALTLVVQRYSDAIPGHLERVGWLKSLGAVVEETIAFASSTVQ